MPCDESWIYCYDQETEFLVEACWLSQTQESQTEQIHQQTFDYPFFDSTGMIYIHWVPTGQTVNKEYYVDVLRAFRKRFRRNAPVLNPILVTDYLAKMGIKAVPHPPCDFCLFPTLKGCRYETIEEMKEAVTKVIDMLTQEDFHRALSKLLERYNKCIAALLRRRLEFHVCTINKSAHTKKVWKLIK